jgi:hypothetical protein
MPVSTELKDLAQHLTPIAMLQIVQKQSVLRN